MQLRLILIGIVFFAAGCGGFQSIRNGGHSSLIGGGGESVGITDGVVKVRAMIPVQVDSSGKMRPALSESTPIIVVNPTAVRFTLDLSAFVMPAASNAVLSFGEITISDLFDNDLRVCGATGKVKCTQAFIQMYTTGVAGSGVWNAIDGYGMPISASLAGSTPSTVGLTAASAAVVQTHTLTGSKNVFRLRDLTVAPVYEVNADFSDAGAGSYATTLVVEYGLRD